MQPSKRTDRCYAHRTGWTPRKLSWMKETNLERPHAIWFYLYNISKWQNFFRDGTDYWASGYLQRGEVGGREGGAAMQGQHPGPRWWNCALPGLWWWEHKATCVMKHTHAHTRAHGKARRSRWDWWTASLSVSHCHLVLRFCRMLPVPGPGRVHETSPCTF